MMEQMSLFDDRKTSAPLASRLRPETLDDMWDSSTCWDPGSCYASSSRRIRFRP